MCTDIVRGTDMYCDQHREVHTFCLLSGCCRLDPSTVAV